AAHSGSTVEDLTDGLSEQQETDYEKSLEKEMGKGAWHNEKIRGEGFLAAWREMVAVLTLQQQNAACELAEERRLHWGLKNKLVVRSGIECFVKRLREKSFAKKLVSDATTTSDHLGMDNAPTALLLMRDLR
ncbi:hypothetical protein HDU88_001116, partial [Geranomyces variabilis]